MSYSCCIFFSFTKFAFNFSNATPPVQPTVRSHAPSSDSLFRTLYCLASRHARCHLLCPEHEPPLTEGIKTCSTRVPVFVSVPFSLSTHKGTSARTRIQSMHTHAHMHACTHISIQSTHTHACTFTYEAHTHARTFTLVIPHKIESYAL